MTGEFPEYRAVLAGEFVNCARVSTGDEVVAIVVFVDAVEVEVVPCVGAGFS